MRELKPEHIIKLAAIAGAAIVASLLIIFAYLSQELNTVIWLAMGIYAIILICRSIKWLMGFDF